MNPWSLKSRKASFGFSYVEKTEMLHSEMGRKVVNGFVFDKRKKKNTREVGERAK